MKLLHIDSSILGEQSVSRQLTAKLVSAARSKHPEAQVQYRDLAAPPADAPESATDLDAFLEADTLVIGAPMYNLGIPSQLKAWIDRIAVAGKTFRYTEHGPQGLAGGKRVLVASTRGGIYSGDSPAARLEHQESYLRSVFSLLGINELEFVRAEGLNMGEAMRAKALQAADADIETAFA
jgi:FMN-dependent NADH-azoreductase